MVPVANGILRRLSHQRLYEGQYEVLQLSLEIELLLYHIRFYPVSIARNLNYNAGRGAATAQQRGNAGKSLITDNGKSHRCAVLHSVQGGNDAVRRKIQVSDRRARLINCLAQRHRRKFHIR